MTPIAVTDKLFFERPEAELAREDAARIVEDALHGADDGELYLEYRESEGLSLEDGRIRSASFDSTLGFGLRAVSGRGAGLRPCRRAQRGRAEAGRGDGEGGALRPFGRGGRAAAGEQCAALHGREPASRDGIRRARQACSPRSTPMRAARTRG